MTSRDDQDSENVREIDLSGPMPGIEVEIVPDDDNPDDDNPDDGVAGSGPGGSGPGGSGPGGPGPGGPGGPEGQCADCQEEDGDYSHHDITTVPPISTVARPFFDTTVQRGAVAGIVTVTWSVVVVAMFYAILFADVSWDSVGEPFLAVTSVATGVFGFYAPRH